MQDIVICVDGTNSKDYKNSSVKNFHDSVAVDRAFKIYEPGPTAWGGVTGSDWSEILNTVIGRLDNIARANGEESFLNGYSCTVGRKPNFRFIMVGHSRGCHILIHLAAKLKYRTYFMGLYDAVERTTSRWDDSTVIYNVDHIYHAIRDASVGSRPYFGNTGLKKGDGPGYFEKKFKTSHGGVGGDVLVDPGIATSILSMTNFGRVADHFGGTGLTFADTSCAILPLKQSAEQVRRATLCITESHEADRFIRDNARKLGVKI